MFFFNILDLQGGDIMKKLFLIILMVLAFIGISITAPIIEDGYLLYKNAVTSTTIEDKVNEIRNDKNYIHLNEVDKNYLASLIKSEDRRFYYHMGVDPIAITRAIFHNIVEGRYAEGGSTITQQLAKNLYFSFEKEMQRKVAEVFVAGELERVYTKDEILELYINIIYFGENCYGIKDASLHYFNKLPNTLTKEEIDALVITIKAPNYYNPNKLNFAS